MVTFTQEEIGKIKETFDKIDRRMLPNGRTPIHADDKPIADGYGMMAKLLQNRLNTDHSLSQAERTEIEYVKTWFEGAEKVNRGIGSFSTLIRTYSDIQGELRYGSKFTSELMQQASNKVGSNAFFHLKKQIDSGDVVKIPTMADIAKQDATGVGEVLFDRDKNDTAHAESQNSAWSGVSLFSVLGNDQTNRILNSGEKEVFDNLTDLRDSMFLVESFRHAFAETAKDPAVSSAILTLLTNGSGAIIQPHVIKLFKEMGMFLSFEMMGNFVNEFTAYKSKDFNIVSTDVVQSLADIFLLAITKGHSAYGTIKNVIKYGNYNVLEALQEHYNLSSENVNYDNFVSNAYQIFSKDKVHADMKKGVAWLPDNSAAISQKALQDSKEGLAFRYALKKLNPIVFGEEFDFTKHNEHGELNLYSPENPNGMTETYIQKRAEMAAALLEYSPHKEINKPSDFYYDLESNQQISKYAVVGMWGAYLNKKVLFGTSDDDTGKLIGGEKDDFLFGGEGDDTLEGNSGRNYLEGGKGNDTYIIDSSGNILFDADMKGKIIFKGGVFGADIQAARFERDESDKNLGVWYSVDKTGKADKKFTAIKRDNDLHIIHNNANDSVLVKDFFALSQFENNAFRGLGLILSDRDKKQDEEGYKLYLGDQHAPVRGTNKVYDWSKTSWNNKTGVLNGAIKKADFDDVINGSSVNDKIHGLGGNDALAGLDGDDWLDGGVGDDLIVGGAGRDKLFGGQGNDFIASDGYLHINNRYSENDQWNLPSRFSSYFSKGPQWGVPEAYFPIRNKNGEVVNYETVVYNPTAISMFSTPETQYLSNSSQMGDEIDGGEGNDMLYGSNADDIIYGGDGRDFLSGWGGNDTLIGGEGNDSILGDGDETDRVFNKLLNGVDIISGGNGHDIIIAGGGNDIVYGDGGNDKIYGDSDSDPDIIGDDYLNGGDGEDRIWGGKGNDIIDGGKDKDVLSGDGGNDELYGRDGDDVLWGLEGDDILYGGDGDDFIAGDDGRLSDQGKLTGNDYLYGGNGSDSMYGGKGNDYLYGDNGRDYLYGGEGDDYLYGGEGTDYLEGNKGTNYLTGGAGNDFFRTSKAQAGINIITDFQDGDSIITLDEKNEIVSFVRIENDLVLLPQYAYSGELNADNKIDVINSSNVKTIVKDFFKLPKNAQGKIYNYTVEKVIELLRNHAPVVSTPIPVAEATEGLQFTYILPENLFSDPDNDLLDINVTLADGSALPNWLSYNPANRTLSGIPDFESSGSLNLKITATDGEGLSAAQDWRIDIANSNRAPSVTGALGTQTLKAGQAWSYVLPVNNHFSDPDGDRLNYRITLADGSPLPAWLQYDAASHTLSGTPTHEQQLHLKVLANDAEQAEAFLPLTLQIDAASQPVVPPSHPQDSNKNLNGSRGHDHLLGGSGHDTLRGFSGNDSLTGGKGNDRLEGGLGNDTYVFSKGDGRDRIFDQAGKDTLRLQGLNADQLWFKREGNKLKVQVIGTQDEISVENHYAFGTPPIGIGHRLPIGVHNHFGVSMPPAKGAGQIETFRLDNGRSLSSAQADRLIQAMAAFRPQQSGNLSVPEQMQQYLQQINVSSFWK